MKTELMKLAAKPEDAANIPEGPHFAVVEFRTVSEATGYEENPSYDVNVTEYYWTTNKEAWEAHIRANVHTGKKFFALKVEGKAKIERPVVIS